MAKHCVFCGSSGTMSKEHIFGKWLLEYSEQSERAPHVSGGINTVLHVQGEFVPSTQVVRAVCRVCNNGWLSELEADAKRALAPILKGQRTELSVSAANRVATWALKTTLVAMLTFSDSERESGVGVPESEYHALFAARMNGLPAETRAWMGRYSGEMTSSVWIVPLALTIDGAEADPYFPQGYASTLVVSWTSGLSCNSLGITSIVS
jgi:hypothetical protein